MTRLLFAQDTDVIQPLTGAASSNTKKWLPRSDLKVILGKSHFSLQWDQNINAKHCAIFTYLADYEQKKILAGDSWWAQNMLQVPWVCFWQHRYQSQWWWQVECGVVSSTLQCEQWYLQVCQQWSLQQSLLVRVHSQQHKVWVTFAQIIAPSCQQKLYSGSTSLPICKIWQPIL